MSANQDKIWEYFQNENKDSFLEAKGRYKFLVSNLKEKSKVLNIGVGDGGLEKISSSKVDIYALDPSYTSISYLKNEFSERKDNFKVGYSQSIPFEDFCFDFVVMSEVLEHLEDDILHMTLAEVGRVLKPNGKFVITVPFEEKLSDNTAVCPCCEHVFHRWGHVHSFSIDSLSKLIVDNGFVIDKLQVRAFPNYERKGIVNFIKSILRFVLGGLRVKLAQPNIFIIARKSDAV
ncbi:Methyltransferase type 11 [Vibrio ichthyoenteri ATCC 700023]|uniref:Methyltransferase type 11 n=1 Tax=Vibrio ichthyoenteri ATCC 700023 TaxID=870968 RepID=F9S4N5_9VIBR|nr:class I SAM-dependent methyltransferase [Vibrio ichthyoenteri]EGU36725.1 Methyltransferase type 11 [Vibrio ichthyoenteri ATCC 700023]